MSTLADLRAESLKEQKTPEASADAEVRTSASPQVRKPVRTEVREEASTAVSTAVSTPAREDVRTAASADGSADGLTQRIRDAVAAKRTHAGGVKTTVEMTPELSIRMKRYCLDHGNVPARLVFLELAEAFLAEEGY